jgi:hypothetical protein
LGIGREDHDPTPEKYTVTEFPENHDTVMGRIRLTKGCSISKEEEEEVKN